jgi:hypothetical protein
MLQVFSHLQVPISVTRLEREKEMGIKSSESMEAEHPIVKTGQW